MSTLPQMFRNVQSSFIRPNKQGGIFSIRRNLMSADTNYQIIQPEQIMILKLCNSTENSMARTTNSFQRKKNIYGDGYRYINNGQPQRRNSLYQNRRPSSQFRKDSYSHYGSTKQAFAVGEPQKSHQSTIEALENRFNQSVKEMNGLREQLCSSIKNCNEMNYQIRALNSKVHHEIEQIKQSSQIQFKKLRKLLSQLRRQSGMETKVNKNDVNQVQSQVQNFDEIMGEVDGKIRQLVAMCVK